MVELHLTDENLRILAAFEQVAHAQARDYIDDGDRLVFVVDAKELGKAVGKGGERVRRLRELLRRDVDVVGYSEDPETFVRNVFHRYEVESVALDVLPNGLLATVKVASKDRGRAIGRNSRTQKLMKQILERNSEVKDLRVR